VDGILYNDAFKHNHGETNNESWSGLLQELKFFDEDIDDHPMFLRQRFVLGAAEFMSGKNNSKQNDKTLFGYTDEEWEFIWMTMLADGAWAVPSIKDNEGNTIKDNCAPEILIKYIAHDLRCNIIVFDLNLNRVQFLSGNHVKDNNVAFESPLVLYATGEHFQSVFQTDQEYFINYARELEAANHEEAGSRGSVLEHHNPSFNQNARLSPSQNSAKPSLSKKKETEQSCRSPSISQDLTVLERDAIIINIIKYKTQK